MGAAGQRACRLGFSLPTPPSQVQAPACSGWLTGQAAMAATHGSLAARSNAGPGSLLGTMQAPPLLAPPAEAPAQPGAGAKPGTALSNGASPCIRALGSRQ